MSQGSGLTRLSLQNCSSGGLLGAVWGARDKGSLEVSAECWAQKTKGQKIGPDSHVGDF